MGCVRRRGTKWNAQVRIAGWRSFTKTFEKKSDALNWCRETESAIRSAPLNTSKSSPNLKFRDLIEKYRDTVTPTHKGHQSETYRLNRFANSWIGRVKVAYLTPRHFEQYRNDRLETVKQCTVRFSLFFCEHIGYTAEMTGKDSGFRIRVERDLRDKFVETCRAQDRPAAQVIRDFMRAFIAQQEKNITDDTRVKSDENGSS